jgi:hypothetical protein
MKNFSRGGKRPKRALLLFPVETLTYIHPAVVAFD